MNEIGIKDQRFSVGVSFSGIPRERAGIFYDQIGVIPEGFV